MAGSAASRASRICAKPEALPVTSTFIVDDLSAFVMTYEHSRFRKRLSALAVVQAVAGGAH
jgi:hypothetical protein